MQSQVVRRLIELNQAFYRQVAKSFDQTRQVPWDGWKQLAKHFSSGNSVLDIAGGNARLARFLIDDVQLHNIKYTNLESNSFLLEQTHTIPLKNGSTISTINLDILSALLSESNQFPELNQSFDVVVCFGFLHHVPGHELRKLLMAKLSEFLNPGGKLLLSTWQFDLDLKLMNRATTPTQLGFDQNQLEPGDYFLDWKRDDTAIRYCHLITPDEMEQLVKDLSLRLLESFTADRTNHYYVYQKTTSDVKLVIKENKL